MNESDFPSFSPAKTSNKDITKDITKTKNNADKASTKDTVRKDTDRKTTDASAQQANTPQGIKGAGNSKTGADRPVTGRPQVTGRPHVADRPQIPIKKAPAPAKGKGKAKKGETSVAFGSTVPKAPAFQRPEPRGKVNISLPGRVWVNVLVGHF